MKGRLAFLERWYEGVKVAARHPNAERTFAGICFIESSVFPIPPDVMLIPMVQAAPERAWRLATIATVFSVLGGMFGYVLGLLLFDALALPVLESLGKAEAVTEFSTRVETYGALAVFGAGLTPFPYKVITIMSGALKINFAVFMAASVLSRGLRFFLVAWVVKTFGARAEAIMKEHFGWFTVGLFVLLAAAYWGYTALMH
ncbi:YqaA family protein [uncultured Algimonas sp.]|uniref:YqaA family protein n=1 Tax=uncultured Algimonas sp. TaxID=1547920 RepID=UPI00261B3542|nr:YqaA family protein [uncultured Algimonas sp.]